MRAEQVIDCSVDDQYQLRTPILYRPRPGVASGGTYGCSAAHLLDMKLQDLSLGSSSLPMSIHWIGTQLNDLMSMRKLKQFVMEFNQCPLHHFFQENHSKSPIALWSTCCERLK